MVSYGCSERVDVNFGKSKVMVFNFQMGEERQ